MDAWREFSRKLQLAIVHKTPHTDWQKCAERLKSSRHGEVLIEPFVVTELAKTRGFLDLHISQLHISPHGITEATEGVGLVGKDLNLKGQDLRFAY